MCPVTVLMWEVRAAAGRLDELVEYVCAHADPRAQVYRADDVDPRVVLIDPTGQGIGDVPERLIARPGYTWHFEQVAR